MIFLQETALTYFTGLDLFHLTIITVIYERCHMLYIREQISFYRSTTYWVVSAQSISTHQIINSSLDLSCFSIAREALTSLIFTSISD